jgi:hypothetical protein
MCPAGLQNICTGKESYPTLVWEATVDHHMKFMAVTKSYFGSRNDKTICKYDKFICDLRNAEFQQIQYQLFNKDGEISVHRNPYLICDGGYMRWKELITGFKVNSNLSEALWSSQMESTRKDVERSFGI